MDTGGAAQVWFGPQTMGAMVVALVVYVFGSFLAVAVLAVAADAFAFAIDWLLGGVRPNVIQLVGSVLGAVAGIWAARLACDLTFDAYRPRAVFWMFVVVLTMTTVSRFSLPFTTTQAILGAQYVIALTAALHYFWRERAPLGVATELIRSD
ncbi:hypothetical protein WHT83_01525 [Aminobacter sp. P9b]|uniref:hypothetical protein n=1 Tax=Aminobacter TaxID=31988 RepID=UPI000D395D3E|nr:MULTISPECIES: hypothetical protein [Aminobacter]AWC22014.1 hypothetical protein CO731_01468 [Aminobacter sp. MSH1]CAI2932795.1 conserved membrane protein of unknown function [Aminobacter niigataensis]